MTTELLQDALAISAAWSSDLNLRAAIERQLRDAGAFDGDVDIVAVGKASREMALATKELLGNRVRRQLVIVDEGPAFSMDTDVEFVIGEHPRPGLGSLLAGERLVAFLESSSSTECTVFLVSGGASSLCALPQSPVTLDDLGDLFGAVLLSGADITTLNRLRAASSSIAGGAVLRRIRTPRSLALIMVDNVVSGERWVASGLTFDYTPTRGELDALLHAIELKPGRLAEKLVDAVERRGEAMHEPVRTRHVNRVIADPSLVLASVAGEGARRGYRVIELGSTLHGDIEDVVALFANRVQTETGSGPLCVVGVGEVTLRVRGTGVGGRCQDFAWRIAAAFDGDEHDIVAVARATDGQDYVKGIAGGWVDSTTLRRARERGIDWSSVVATSDSFTALDDLGQLIAGGRTGWNLCDVYLVVVDA